MQPLEVGNPLLGGAPRRKLSQVAALCLGLVAVICVCSLVRDPLSTVGAAFLQAFPRLAPAAAAPSLKERAAAPYMMAATIPDTKVAMMVYWDIKDEAKFNAGIPEFAELTKNEPGNAYYGFATKEGAPEAVCKEGYTDAQAFLDHLANVDAPLQKALEAASIPKIDAHGPKAELEKLKEPLKDLPVSYWPLEDGAYVQSKNFEPDMMAKMKAMMDGGASDDTKVAMMVYWEYKAEDEAKFKAALPEFTELTKNEPGNAYYGFTIKEQAKGETKEAVCKEGYKSAQAFLDHLENVDGPLQKALEVASIPKIDAHGPKAELEKLKEPLKDFPVSYWPLEDGAYYKADKFGAA